MRLFHYWIVFPLYSSAPVDVNPVQHEQDGLGHGHWPVILLEMLDRLHLSRSPWQLDILTTETGRIEGCLQNIYELLYPRRRASWAKQTQYDRCCPTQSMNQVARSLLSCSVCAQPPPVNRFCNQMPSCNHTLHLAACADTLQRSTLAESITVSTMVTASASPC